MRLLFGHERRGYRQQSQPTHLGIIGLNPKGVPYGLSKHLVTSADADNGGAVASKLPYAFRQSGPVQIIEVGDRCLGARQYDKVRAAQVIGGAHVPEVHTGISFQGIEVVEVGDMRQGDDGDVEHGIVCRMGNILGAGRVLLGDVDVPKIGHYPEHGHVDHLLELNQPRL